MRLLLASVILFLFSFSSQAALDIDISEPTLEISTGFDGDTLTLFGTANRAGDIVVLVKGPEQNTIIRRKLDVFGLWVHARAVKFENVPQYYNVASSRSVLDIADTDTRLKYKMGINSLVFTPDDDDIPAERTSRFLEALIQNMQLSGLYSLTPDAVEFINDTLFKTRIHMPSNVPIGDYTIEAFLFKNGDMIATQSHPFKVEQVGLTADIHDFAIEKPFFYGISVIIIAILSSLLGILLLRRE
jgi:uncharacterized protein (TIGR02186 family)